VPEISLKDQVCAQCCLRVPRQTGPDDGLDCAASNHDLAVSKSKSSRVQLSAQHLGLPALTCIASMTARVLGVTPR
jgi:hypothetical protein